MIPRSDLEIFCTDEMDKTKSPFDHLSLEESKSAKDFALSPGLTKGKKKGKAVAVELKTNFYWESDYWSVVLITSS